MRIKYFIFVLITTINGFKIQSKSHHYHRKLMSFNPFKFLGSFGRGGPSMDLDTTGKMFNEVSEKTEKIRNKLENTIVIGQNPTGEVTCIFNGLTFPIKIELKESFMKNSAEIASAELTYALLDGHNKSKAALTETVHDLLQEYGIDIPLDKLTFG